MSCPAGTVPIRRITLDEVTRFETLQHYRRIQRHLPARGGSADGLPEAADVAANTSHEYAFGAQDVANLGGHSFLNVWRPAVDSNQTFSLSQQWYIATTPTGEAQTVEVGWHVFPQRYGHSNPVLFTLWTPDNYVTAPYGPENFVQQGTHCPIGIALEDVSTIDGTQAEIELMYHLIDGKWWLFAYGSDQAHAIGYYPASLFQNGPMANGASRIEFGGETLSSGSHPPMGSGEFANAGYQKAAYQRNIYYFPAAGGNAQDAALAPNQAWPTSYTIAIQQSSDWGENFYFGGPGDGPSTLAAAIAPLPTIGALSQPDTRGTVLFLIALAVAVAAATPFFDQPFWPWLIELGLTTGVFMALGVRFKRYWFGILVDGRNKISLSRAQIVAWTILFVTTFLVIYVWNVGHPPATGGFAAALNLTVPDAVWLLMGISGVSAAGSPLILSAKPDPKPNDPPPPPPQDPNEYLDGVVVKRNSGAKPAWTDILLGDEAGIADSIDVSKVQQLMLSLVALVAYGFAIARTLLAAAGSHIDALPGMENGFLALIAASHATYLGYKAAPHSN